MSESFDLQAPDHFTAGAIGAPGQRVFYVQARERGALVTLKAEKEHVGGLADYLDSVLGKKPVASADMPSDLGLLEPVTPAWAIGAIGVGYDEAEDRVLVVANELVRSENEEEDEEEEDDEQEEGAAEDTPEDTPEGATARFRITRAQAARFAERARALMKAGRPTCQVCGGPIDPGGHLCPRRNGHKP
jgi:uncharacterized repeat protein (TIGR03847 family)